MDESVFGEADLKTKLVRLLESEEPIEFVLPSFPFKSFCERKVITPGHVDLAEVIALETLSHIRSELSKCHDPGIKITIVPDAIRVTSCLGVKDERKKYQDQLQKLCPYGVHIKPLSSFVDERVSGKSLEEIAGVIAAEDVDVEARFLRESSGFVKQELSGSLYKIKLYEKLLAETGDDSLGLALDQRVSLAKLKSYLHGMIQPAARPSRDFRRQVKAIQSRLQNLGLKKLIKTCKHVNAEESLQFSRVLCGLYSGYESSIRLSVNFHGINLAHKFPIELVYGNTVTPHHNSAVVQKIGDVAIIPISKVLTNPKRDLTTLKPGLILREETFNGLVIKYYQEIDS